VIGQLSEHGKFLASEDAGMIAAQAFVGSWFPYLGPDGVKHLPHPGEYRDQPDELMEIMNRIWAALKGPR
jgi:hypothetical protein